MLIVNDLQFLTTLIEYSPLVPVVLTGLLMLLSHSSAPAPFLPYIAARNAKYKAHQENSQLQIVLPRLFQ